MMKKRMVTSLFSLCSYFFSLTFVLADSGEAFLEALIGTQEERLFNDELNPGEIMPHEIKPDQIVPYASESDTHFTDGYNKDTQPQNSAPYSIQLKPEPTVIANRSSMTKIVPDDSITATASEAEVCPCDQVIDLESCYGVKAKNREKKRERFPYCFYMMY
jgi:hypothetical protein